MMIDRVAEQDGRILSFPLLSDADHAVIDRYGLRNQEDPRDRPIPHPTVFVIDREGRVAWKFIEINYKIRPTNEDIMGALDRLHGRAPASDGGMAGADSAPADSLAVRDPDAVVDTTGEDAGR